LRKPLRPKYTPNPANLKQLVGRNQAPPKKTCDSAVVPGTAFRFGTQATQSSGPKRMQTHKTRKRHYWRQHGSAPRKPDTRPSSSQRGYDVKWQRFRIWFIRRNPLCAHCQAKGRLTPATEIDHKAPLIAGGERFNPANCQALCGTHHRRKTAQDRKKYPEYAHKSNVISRDIKEG